MYWRMCLCVVFVVMAVWLGLILMLIVSGVL